VIYRQILERINLSRIRGINNRRGNGPLQSTQPLIPRNQVKSTCREKLESEICAKWKLRMTSSQIFVIPVRYRNLIAEIRTPRSHCRSSRTPPKKTSSKRGQIHIPHQSHFCTTQGHAGPRTSSPFAFPLPANVRVLKGGRDLIS
jgi:hypothetical protein